MSDRRGSIYPIRLLGNSLTPEEYRDTIIDWVRRHRIKASGVWGDTLPPEDIADDLIATIWREESRSMIQRFGAGEDWPAIKASSQGPPRT